MTRERYDMPFSSRLGGNDKAGKAGRCHGRSGACPWSNCWWR